MPKHETTLRNRKNSKKLPVFEKRQTPEEHILSIDDKFIPFSTSDLPESSDQGTRHPATYSVTHPAIYSATQPAIYSAMQPATHLATYPATHPSIYPITKINIPFKSKSPSIKDIPAYQSPPKNAKVSHAYDYHPVISDPQTSPTPGFAKFIAKQLVSHFTSHLVSDLVSDLAFNQLSNLLSSLGVSPLAFIMFTLSFAHNVQATNSIALMDGFPPEGLDLCSPKARMIYCEQFYTVSAENTSLLTDPLIQGVTKLITDEQWSKSFNHYNFLFDLKEKLQCIDIEKLKSIFIENFLPLNHLNHSNNGTLFDPCLIEGQVQKNDWVYTLTRGLAGVSPEMCQKFKNVNPSFEIGCMSHWNYSMHATAAFLITAGSTLFSFFIYFCIKDKINRQPDARIHPDLTKVKADKSPIKITLPSLSEQLSARKRGSLTVDRKSDLRRPDIRRPELRRPDIRNSDPIGRKPDPIDRKSDPIGRKSDPIGRNSDHHNSDLFALRNRSSSLSPPRPFAFDKRHTSPPKGSFLTVPKQNSPERGSLLSDKRNKATTSSSDSNSPRVRIDPGSPKFAIDIRSPRSDARSHSPILSIDTNAPKPDAHTHSSTFHIDLNAPKPNVHMHSPTLRIDPQAPISAAHIHSPIFHIDTSTLKPAVASPTTTDLSSLRSPPHSNRSIQLPPQLLRQSPHQSLPQSHSFSEKPAEKYYIPLRNRNRNKNQTRDPNRNRRITLPIDQKSLVKKPQDQPLLPDDSGLDSFSPPSHSQTISESSSSQKNSFVTSPPSDSLVFPSAAESPILQKSDSNSLSPVGDSNSYSHSHSHSHSRSHSRLQTHSHMHTHFIPIKDDLGPAKDVLVPVRDVSGQISDVSVLIRKDSGPRSLSTSYDDPRTPILISPGSPPPIKSLSRSLGIRTSERPSERLSGSHAPIAHAPSASVRTDITDITNVPDAVLLIPESSVSVSAFSPSASISPSHLATQNLLVKLSTHSIHFGSSEVEDSSLVDASASESGKKRALSTISENYEGLQKVLGSFKPVT